MIVVSFQGNAAAKPKLPEVVYAETGGLTYRFDYSDVRQRFGEWIRSGEGCLDVVVSRAAVSGSPEVHGFAFGDDPSPEDVTVLSSAPADLAVDRWDPVLTHRLCRSPRGIRFEQNAGADRMTWEFSAALLVGEAPPGATVRITANGHAEEIDASYLFLLANRLAQGDDPSNEPVSEAFGSLFWRLKSPSTLVNAFYGYLWASKAFESVYEMPNPILPHDCVVPCGLCAAYAILFLTAGPAGLAAGCAAAIGTGGILAPACIAALGGYVALAASTTGSCYYCGTCLGPGGPPPADDCPTGYHECCNNCCCSNDDPPDSCAGCL